MIVFHGGYCPIKLPEIIKGKYTKDFGSGFYCTNLEEQAVRWAMRYETPVVSTYNFVADSDLDILHFEEMTEKWLDFIVDCRHGIDHKHDIVIGAMANDQVYNYISDFVNGILTREQFWVLAEFKHPTHQINFCTERAVKCLTFTQSEKFLK